MQHSITRATVDGTRSPGGERRIRVFVLSEVRLYSEGLATLLSGEDAIEVVGAASADEPGVQQALAARPDVVLVDGATLRAGDACRRLREGLPATLLVAFGVSEERDEVLACAQRGAAGYVPRDASSEDLVRIVRSVERGELPCPPRVASILFRQLAAVGAADAERGDAGPSSLTHRERQVVALIDRGMSNKEIAAALGIEVATVKNHVHRLLEKLAVHGRSAAAARVRRLTGDARLQPR